MSLDGTPGTARGETFLLRLYVAGQTPKSLTGFANLREICGTHLAGRYEIEVIDVYQQPVLTAGEKIVAAPTLTKTAAALGAEAPSATCPTATACCSDWTCDQSSPS